MSPKELEKHKLNYIDINEGLVNEDVDVGGGNEKKPYEYIMIKYTS